jgi:hypothetical protein
VQIVDTGSASDDVRSPIDGTALCLSGGAYRAMLFHVGAIWRLNELGYLPKLAAETPSSIIAVRPTPFRVTPAAVSSS